MSWLPDPAGRTLDHLLPHKAALERHLTARYGELFTAEFDGLLYDPTSSHIEGAAPKNPMMRRGYSPWTEPGSSALVPCAGPSRALE